MAEGHVMQEPQALLVVIPHTICMESLEELSLFLGSPLRSLVLTVCTCANYPRFLGDL